MTHYSVNTTKNFLESLAEHILWYKRGWMTPEASLRTTEFELQAKSRNLLFGWFIALAENEKKALLTCTDPGTVQVVQNMQRTKMRRSAAAHLNRSGVYFKVLDRDVKQGPQQSFLQEQSAARMGLTKIQKEELLALGVLESKCPYFKVLTSKCANGDFIQLEWNTAAVEACLRLEQNVLFNMNGPPAFIISSDALKTPSVFLDLLVQISGGWFGFQSLTNRESLDTNKQMMWLQKLPKYPIGAFICNQLEILLWRGYKQHQILTNLQRVLPTAAGNNTAGVDQIPDRKLAVEICTKQKQFQSFWLSLPRCKQVEILGSCLQRGMIELVTKTSLVELKSLLEYTNYATSRSPASSANKFLEIMRLTVEQTGLRIMLEMPSYFTELRKAFLFSDLAAEELMFSRLGGVSSLFAELKRQTEANLMEEKSDSVYHQLMVEVSETKDDPSIQKKRKKNRRRQRSRISPMAKVKNNEATDLDLRELTLLATDEHSSSKTPTMLARNAPPPLACSSREEEPAPSYFFRSSLAARSESTVRLRGKALVRRRRAQIIALQVLNEVIDAALPCPPAAAAATPLAEARPRHRRSPSPNPAGPPPAAARVAPPSSMGGGGNDKSSRKCIDNDGNNSISFFNESLFGQADPYHSHTNEQEEGSGILREGDDVDDLIGSIPAYNMFDDDVFYDESVGSEYEKDNNNNQRRGSRATSSESVNFDGYFGGSGIFSWRPALESRLSSTTKAEEAQNVAESNIDEETTVFERSHDKSHSKGNSDQKEEEKKGGIPYNKAIQQEASQHCPAAFQQTVRRNSMSDVSKLDSIAEVSDSADENSSQPRQFLPFERKLSAGSIHKSDLRVTAQPFYAQGTVQVMTPKLGRRSLDGKKSFQSFMSSFVSTPPHVKAAPFYLDLEQPRGHHQPQISKRSLKIEEGPATANKNLLAPVISAKRVEDFGSNIGEIQKLDLFSARSTSGRAGAEGPSTSVLRPPLPPARNASSERVRFQVASPAQGTLRGDSLRRASVGEAGGRRISYDGTGDCERVTHFPVPAMTSSGTFFASGMASVGLKRREQQQEEEEQRAGAAAAAAAGEGGEGLRLREDNALLRDMCLRLEAEVAKYRNLVATQRAGLQAAQSTTQGPLAARLAASTGVGVAPPPVGSPPYHRPLPPPAPLPPPGAAFWSPAFLRSGGGGGRNPYHHDTMSDDGGITPGGLHHHPMAVHHLGAPHQLAYRGSITPDYTLHNPMMESVLPPYIQPQLGSAKSTPTSAKATPRLGARPSHPAGHGGRPGARATASAAAAAAPAAPAPRSAEPGASAPDPGGAFAAAAAPFGAGGEERGGEDHHSNVGSRGNSSTRVSREDDDDDDDDDDVTNPLLGASLLALSAGFAAGGAGRSLLGGGAATALRSRLCEDLFRLLSTITAEEQRLLEYKVAAFHKCKSVVRRLWPRAQVHTYGSFSTGLSLPASDLDLVICLPKVMSDAPAVAPGDLEGRNAIKETWQQNLARYFRLENWVMNKSIKIISHTAIPVIKLATESSGLQEDVKTSKRRRRNVARDGGGPPGDGSSRSLADDLAGAAVPDGGAGDLAGPVPPIELDISFEDPGHQGLEANQMVIHLLDEFPSIRPIVLANKLFLKKRGLLVVYTGGLSSYALVLMAARYLQEQHQQMDTGSLLLGFLDFYGNHFDPRAIGISVRRRCYFSRQASGLPASFYQGRPVLHPPALTVMDRRSSFGDILPPSHPEPAHSSNGDEMQVPYKFDPLFVEDPLCPGNNVGRNCFRIAQVQRAWADAFQALTAALDQEEGPPPPGGPALRPLPPHTAAPPRRPGGSTPPGGGGGAPGGGGGAEEGGGGARPPPPPPAGSPAGHGGGGAGLLGYMVEGTELDTMLG